MRPWIGRTLTLIGALHLLLGVVSKHSALTGLAADGVVNAGRDNASREAAFWFLYRGFALIILGEFIRWIEMRHKQLPMFLPWAFLSLTVVGILAIPISGVLLLVVPLWGMFMRARKAQAKRDPGMPDSALNSTAKLVENLVFASLCGVLRSHHLYVARLPSGLTTFGGIVRAAS